MEENLKETYLEVAVLWVEGLTVYAGMASMSENGDKPSQGPVA